MSKILNFKGFQDDDDDEMLQMQKSALKSTAEFDPPLETANISPVQSSKNIPSPSGSEGKVSVLEKNTVITGSISSVTTIEIEGIVNGNVSCKNDVLISGTVTGDIDAANVRLTSGHVKGNIICRNAVAIDRESAIKGNISGELLDCDGKVEGNTRIKGKATITSNAVIYGDISAGSISLDEGVELKGMLNVSKNAKSEESKPETKAKESKELHIDGSKYI